MHKFLHFRVPLRGSYFLVLLSFLVALSISFIAPVFPLYIKSLVSKEAYVGYITAAIAILLLISSFLVSWCMNSYKKIKLLKIGLLGCAVTVMLLSVINKLSYFLILEIVRSFFLVSIYFTIALFIRHYAAQNNLGKFEGMHYTVSNLAWLIGPLLGATIATKSGISTVFLLGSIFPAAALILVIMHPLREDKLISNNHNHTFENIASYFKDKDLRNLYLISLGLMMWWAAIYTFAPLFIIDSGFGTDFIGYLFFAIAIPLILLEVPIGKLADRYGFRKYLFYGLIIIGICALLTYFFSPLIVLVLLVLAGFGAAMLEPLRDAYLFKMVKPEELTQRFAVYRTSGEVGQIIGPIIFSTILLISGFKYFYSIVGLVILFFSIFALRLKEIKNEVHSRASRK